MSTYVSKIFVGEKLKEAIDDAVSALGSWEKYVAKGETVLLKPNFNTADPFPGSTDPEFLRACVELFYEKGAGKIIVADSSTFSASTQKVMEKLGVFELENLTPPAKVQNFDRGDWKRKKISEGKYLKSVSLPKILNEVDKIVFLPCCKTHYIAQFTGALKLSVGLMKKSEKMLMHATGHVQEKISELNTLIDPSLVIMDARKCFVTEGPMNGETRKPGIVMASESRTEIDIEGIKIIKSYVPNDLEKVIPEQLVQIKYAQKLGVE